MESNPKDVLMQKMNLVIKEKKRKPTPGYLKWDNFVVGFIAEGEAVDLFYPEHLSKFFNNEYSWSWNKFLSELSDRIPPKNRRGIQKILLRAGLTDYNVWDLACATRAISARDRLWLAYEVDEDYDEVINKMLPELFGRSVEMEGGSIVSPDGVNRKYYGRFRGRLGIFKERLNSYTTDVESEVVVSKLGKLLGVETCDVKRTARDTTFSCFNFDFNSEYIVHYRRILSGSDLTQDYRSDLREAMPEFKSEIDKMILLDFITNQDDRHLSNIALKVGTLGISFYPLYDCGRSLFYEDTADRIKEALKDPELYSTSFGPVGTYLDAVMEISSETDISSLINLEITRKQVSHIFIESEFIGEKAYLLIEWIMNRINFLKKLNKS